jgi:hypothetical protein
VKISAITGAMKFLDSVRERRDRQEGGGGGADPGSSGRGGTKGDESPAGDSDTHAREKTPSFEEIRQAIEDFKKDALASKNGLTALLTGEGTDARVTLQDDQGNHIRQLTGEEFLRLRAAGSSQTERPRGKILDQKL